jgi:hypothetical protein
MSKKQKGKPGGPKLSKKSQGDQSDGDDAVHSIAIDGYTRIGSSIMRHM